MSKLSGVRSLGRLGRYLKLFVSTVGPSSHECKSQFGLANLFLGENPPKQLIHVYTNIQVSYNELSSAIDYLDISHVAFIESIQSILNVVHIYWLSFSANVCPVSLPMVLFLTA